MRNERSRVVGPLGLALTLAGCAHQPIPPPTPQVSPDLQITLATTPARPRQMDPTAFRVALRDAQGRPVRAATVTLDLAMPAMDMGRDAIPAVPQGPGIYAGTGRFTMAGDWRVTVTAARGPVRAVQYFPVTVQ